MRYVNTVSGPVSPDQLGRTLMHEHFLFGYCGFQGDATLGGFREEEYLDACLKAVEDARAYGIETIVDATTNECGRNVRFLKRVADLTGIQIVCSTGYYFEAESSFAYWNFRRGFADVGQEIYEMMLTEVTRGIEGTGIKAGVIKLASSYQQITPMEEFSSKRRPASRGKPGWSSSPTPRGEPWARSRRICSSPTAPIRARSPSAICAGIRTFPTTRRC